MSNAVLAQNVKIGGSSIQGPLKDPSGNPITTLGDVVNAVLPFLFGAASIILLFVLIWGGYDFIISRGTPEKIKSAKAKITTGIVGFIFLTVSYLATRLVSQIFGLGAEVFQ